MKEDEFAFPFYDGPGHQLNGPGMSLRDYFAAKAMAGILSNDESAHAPENLDEVVEWCYEIADAMLAAREATCSE